ncbi:MAG: hypothetical protein QOF78_4057, partial [Phycisphaerales bacterium]|nr:hypothetical protein [Phycisphaerales bacterium]
MKRSALLPLLLCALLTVGCVRSLHPIYTEKTLTYDPALLGVWVADDEDGTRLEIAASSGNEQPDAIKSYRVVHTDKDKKSTTLLGHLARVGDMLVADLTIGDETGLPDSDFYKAHLFPLHTFWIVRCDAQRLTLRSLDHDWMKKFIDENPGAIAHYKSNDDVILTAPPEALQKFLLAHARDPEMLTGESVFRRGKPAAT